MSNEYTYKYISTNNLIYNEKCQIVAKFKEFLILDDTTEFLRRFYLKNESNPRLVKILNFYETYSKIFPNYMILPESSYLYKNIRKKQKMIDAMNEIRREEEENKKLMGSKSKNSQKSSKENAVFSTQIKNSISNYKASSFVDKEENIDNSNVSISLVSRKFTPNMTKSFIQMNDTDSSIIDMLKELNRDVINRGITVKHKQKKARIRKHSQENSSKNLLETPRKQKQFIKKIVGTNNHNLMSEASKSNSQKIMSRLTNSNNNKYNQNYKIYNNYQNIIIPSANTNTVINIINNNYYQYQTSTETLGNKEENVKKSNVMSPKGKNYFKRIGKVSEQVVIQRGVLSPQPSMRLKTLYKRNQLNSIEKVKSPICQNISKKNILSQRTKSSKIMKTKNKPPKLENIFSGKVINVNENFSSNPNIHKEIKKTKKPLLPIPSKINIKRNVKNIRDINTNKLSNKVHPNIHTENYTLGSSSSPKKTSSKVKEKSLSSTMKTKYKAFMQKIKLNSLSNRNSFDTGMKAKKKKRLFNGIKDTSNNNQQISKTQSKGTTSKLTIHHTHSKSINEKKKRFAIQKSLLLKNESSSFFRSKNIVSPTQTISVNYKQNEPSTPIITKIKVNRKIFLEKIKKSNTEVLNTDILVRTKEKN